MAAPYGAIDAEAGTESYANTPVVQAEVETRSHRRYLPAAAVGLAMLGAAVVVLKTSSVPTAQPVSLWERLSDPDELLKYAAQFEATYDSNTLDDENFWPLSCAEYDDDTVYPNALCLSGDNATCHSDIMNDEYLETCSEACKEGWGVPCGWQAIAELPALCDGTFTATFPSGSNNLDPVVTDDLFNYNALTINMTGESYWACNVHAFCFSCVDSDNVVNDYCKAAVIRTQSLYGASAVMKYMDSYWCEDEIISDIQNGTFCGYTADKMDSCEEKNSHA